MSIAEILADDKTLNDYIGNAVQDFQTQLIRDKSRGHIDEEEFKNIQKTLTDLVQAASDLNFNRVNNHHRKLKELCQYHIKICSKWALLGLALGAFVEGIAILAVSFITKGASIPVWMIALNTTSCGFLGALWGHKIGQYSIKRKADLLVGESIYRHFKSKNDGQAENLKNFSLFSRVKEKITAWSPTTTRTLTV